MSLDGVGTGMEPGGRGITFVDTVGENHLEPCWVMDGSREAGLNLPT